MLREAFGLFKCGRILGFLDSATVECNFRVQSFKSNSLKVSKLRSENIVESVVGAWGALDAVMGMH
jgi:hypothetical protein